MDSPTRRRVMMPAGHTRTQRKYALITPKEERAERDMLRLSPCKRNVTLALGAFLMLCGGTPYMVSLFTSVFEDRMGFTVSQTILVETCTHVGLYCGITQGIIYDKFGLKTAAATAGILLVSGYMGAFVATLRPNGAILMGFCFFLIGQGSHGLYTIAASTNIRNFRTANKGKVMGLLAATFAISGAVFTPIAWQFGIRVSSKKRNATDVQDCSEPATMIIANNQTSPTHSLADAEPLYYFAFIAAIMVVASTAAAFFMYREEPRMESSVLMTELLSYDEDGDEIVPSDDDNDNTKDVEPEVDIYGCQLLVDPRFLLLFLCMLIEDGTAVMFNNALASIYQSIEHEAPYTPAPGTLLIGFSIASASGRGFWGLVADFFHRRRALVLLCTMVLMGLSHLSLVIFPHELLVATIGVGFSFGGMFAIAPVIAAEQFGNAHFGTNWGCVVFAAAAGSTTFNMIFGINYDHNTPEGCVECFGADCFKHTFIITSSCLAAGAVFNILLDSAMTVKKSKKQCAPNHHNTPKSTYNAVERMPTTV
eukprot:m.111538 g.111538  ORF g.111538 m.111538 type:complete len:537 (-) comp28128_c0_seq1:85-1695(-)